MAMKIYTKCGDKGRTSLIGGERVSKFDTRVEAYGTIDELSAHIAMLRDMLGGVSLAEYDDDLVEILRTLMGVESVIAVGKGGQSKVADIEVSHIEALERRIDEINATLPEIRCFTIPGGHVIVSQANICRTVCRRAERHACRAAAEHDILPNALKYINRLSDYLYVLGRKLTRRLNTEEILWHPECGEKARPE